MCLLAPRYSGVYDALFSETMGVFASLSFSVERLQLVCLDWGFILVQVRKRILCAVVVRIIVSVNGLCLQSRNGVELLDGGCAQSCESTEDCPLYLGHLRVLDGVDQGVLRFGCVVLQLLGSVLLTKWCDLVEVHLQVMRHLLGQFVLWSLVLFAGHLLQKCCSPCMCLWHNRHL